MKYLFLICACTIFYSCAETKSYAPKNVFYIVDEYCGGVIYKDTISFDENLYSIGLEPNKNFCWYTKSNFAKGIPCTLIETNVDSFKLTPYKIKL